MTNPTHEKLHYSMADVERDYSDTYSMFMKAAAVGIVGAVIYFFALAVYLGGWGHTHSDDFVRSFAADGRIEMEYKGTKLPMYENPSLVALPVKAPKAEAEAPINAPVAEAAPPVAPPAVALPTGAAASAPVETKGAH